MVLLWFRDSSGRNRTNRDGNNREHDRVPLESLQCLAINRWIEFGFGLWFGSWVGTEFPNVGISIRTKNLYESKY